MMPAVGNFVFRQSVDIIHDYYYDVAIEFSKCFYQDLSDVV